MTALDKTMFLVIATWRTIQCVFRFNVSSFGVPALAIVVGISDPPHPDGILYDVVGWIVLLMGLIPNIAVALYGFVWGYHDIQIEYIESCAKFHKDATK